MRRQKLHLYCRNKDWKTLKQPFGDPISNTIYFVNYAFLLYDNETHLAHNQSDFTYFVLCVLWNFQMNSQFYDGKQHNLTHCRLLSRPLLNGDACRIWKISQVLIWLLWMWHAMPFRQFNSCVQLKYFEREREK